MHNPFYSSKIQHCTAWIVEVFVNVDQPNHKNSYTIVSIIIHGTIFFSINSTIHTLYTYSSKSSNFTALIVEVSQMC